ncbi:GNAT family N-acetyltransferase [Meiothermus sp. CFH 77666]|uniref:GNAT family N-acetyltransferase n=1 Tax=Meiothermus sp. CFH 77666 TaxID=2817942 RepID=UPI001AA0784D|nr:GNAT family N-acetyltransferase [Meiothermus sp. CFH 77666]MBO1438673.1 GNAT family N-acetyltransferase [Meiothermus sp. CFH 77666]
MSLRLDVFSGAEVAPFIPELARLRMTVFREWPYLYEGSLEYEEHYLAKFLEWPESTLVVVRDGERVVGASTALPLAQAEAEFQEPFVKAGLNPAEWYYFGESVLEAAYRGQGLGVAFFHHREARALQFGYRLVTFCAVERPANHPLKPSDYVPLDAFWQRRGFTKRPDLVCHFSWQDLGQAQASAKPMVFWVKAL